MTTQTQRSSPFGQSFSSKNSRGGANRVFFHNNSNDLNSEYIGCPAYDNLHVKKNDTNSCLSIPTNDVSPVSCFFQSSACSGLIYYGVCEGHREIILDQRYYSVIFGKNELEVVPISLRSHIGKRIFPCATFQPLNITKENLIQLRGERNTVETEKIFSNIAMLCSQENLDHTSMQLYKMHLVQFNLGMSQFFQEKYNCISKMWVTVALSTEYSKQIANNSILFQLDQLPERDKVDTGDYIVYRVPLIDLSTIDICIILSYMFSGSSTMDCNSVLPPNVQIIDGWFIYGVGFGIHNEFLRSEDQAVIYRTFYPPGIITELNKKSVLVQFDILVIDAAAEKSLPFNIVLPNKHACIKVGSDYILYLSQKNV